MLSWIVTSCVLILAVLLIRRVFRGKASARAVYALWLFVALRLLIPGSVAVNAPVPAVAEVVNRSPVVQLSDKLDGADSLTLTPEGDVEAHYSAEGQTGGTTQIVAESAGQREFNFMNALVSLKKLVIPAWLCGAAAVALVFALSWMKFSRSVRRSRELIQVPGTPVRVYISDAVDTPCLFGLFSPAVYLPSYVASEGRLMRHALEHELSHYRQRDHIWCVLRCACLALHWYNPLVWLAVKLSKRDCELACDEATVGRLGEAERASYGRSLIRLTCETPRGAVVATAMCARPKELKERITMLTKNKHSIIALALAAVLAFTATACSFVSGDGDASVGSVSYESGINGTYIYDFTAPDGADNFVVTAWYYNGNEWESKLSSPQYGGIEGRIGIDTDLSAGTFGWSVEIDGVTNTSQGNYDLNSLAGSDNPDWTAVSHQDRALEARTNEPVPLVMFGGTKDGEQYARSGQMGFFEQPEFIEDDNLELICITITFTRADGHIAQSERDVSSGKTVFDYTAPSGANSMRFTVYRYDRDSGTWDVRMVSDRACKTDEGKLVSTFDRSERTFGLGVEYSDGTGSSVDGLSFDELAMTSAQNVEDWGNSVPIGSGGFDVGLNTELPVTFYTGVVGDTAYSSIDYFEHPELIEGDDEYICVTVTFFATAVWQDGQVSHNDQLSSGDSERFDYTAPTGADALRVRVYSFTDGAWKSRFDASRPLDRRNGGLTLTPDLTARTLEIITEYTATSSESLDLDELAVNAQNITSWGYTVSLTSERDTGLYTEVPLMLLTGMVGDTAYTGTDYFEHPENIEGDDEYICVTIMFTDADVSTSEPDPITPPTAQSAELMGFESSYDAGDSYEDIASAWVHDYAENLVIGLPESDPAACSGVSIEGYSVVAASMTQPERIIVDVSLWCAPRNRAAFLDFYGQVLYGMPLAGQSSEPATEECDIILSRYLILELDNGVAECVSASSERPDLWGYLSLFSADSYESFLAGLDSSGDGAKQTVARANYSELDELSSESWMALLEALDSVAIDENGDGDQLIRDLYAMHAAVNSDGAYAEWLGGILSEQREHDEASFTLALESFSAEEQQVILTLAAPLT